MSTDRASAVLDASALLAFLDSEPGADVVLRALIAGSYASTVNMAEIYTKNASRPVPLRSVEARLSVVRLVVEPFTQEDARAVGRLTTATRPFGLSLADRACLTLARRLSLPALTADRVWSRLPDIGVVVRLIR